MKVRKTCAFIVMAALLVAMLPISNVNAKTPCYGEMISETQLITRNTPSLGAGTMRLACCEGDSIMKTVTEAELFFNLGWAAADGSNVTWNMSNTSGPSMFDIVRGTVEVEGKTLTEWMGTTGSIRLCFESTEGARSYYDMDQPTGIDAAITGQLSSDDILTLHFPSTPNLGAGTLWVRAYTPDSFGHLLSTTEGHEIQAPLAWESASGNDVFWKTGNEDFGTLFDVLRGLAELDGKSFNEWLGENDKLMLCFESTSGARTWYNYTIDEPVFGNATGEVTSEIQMTTHFNSTPALGEGTMWLRAFTDEQFDGLMRIEDGTPIQFPLKWSGAAGNDINWSVPESIEPDLLDIINGDAKIGDKTIKELMGEEGTLMLCFENAAHERTWYPITDTEPPLAEFRIKRAVAVNATQIVIEFTQPIDIEGTPFFALRLTDKSYNLQWDGETPLQFSGGVVHSKSQPEKILWTLDKNNPFGVDNVADIINRTGRLADYSDFRAMFCIEEVSADTTVGDTEDGTISNITNKDGVALFSNKIGAGKDYDGAYAKVEFDSIYDLNPFTVDIVLWIALAGTCSALIGTAALIGRRKHTH